MDFKAWNEINRAHDRLDALENPARFPAVPPWDSQLLESLGVSHKEALDRITKLEGEIKAMKARMGKVKEIA